MFLNPFELPPRTTLPFTDHIFSRFVSAYERALAPRLLQRMIDGTWDAIQCCREISLRSFLDMFKHFFATFFCLRYRRQPCRAQLPIIPLS